MAETDQVKWKDSGPPADWKDSAPPPEEQKPAPIANAPTMSARPSLVSRMGSAFKGGGVSGLGEELGTATREAISNIPLPGVNKTLGEGLTDLGRMADIAGTEASLLSAPEMGLGIVNLGREGLAAIPRMLRNPATARQSQLGRAGTVKDILPPQLQRWTVPNWMIPKGELGTATRPGPFMEIPARMPRTPTVAPEVDPLAQAVREGRAMRIPPRMPRAKPVPEAAPPGPFEGMTSSAKPIGSAQLPRAETMGTQPEIKMVEKFKPAEKSRIVSPESKPARVEGSYWSFSQSALRKAVMGGDRDAAIVYKQRFGELPEGAGFLTDVGKAKQSGLYQSRRE